MSDSPLPGRLRTNREIVADNANAARRAAAANGGGLGQSLNDYFRLRSSTGGGPSSSTSPPPSSSSPSLQRPSSPTSSSRQRSQPLVSSMYNALGSPPPPPSSSSASRGDSHAFARLPHAQTQTQNHLASTSQVQHAGSQAQPRHQYRHRQSFSHPQVPPTLLSSLSPLPSTSTSSSASTPLSPASTSSLPSVQSAVTSPTSPTSPSSSTPSGALRYRVRAGTSPNTQSLQQGVFTPSGTTEQQHHQHQQHQHSHTRRLSIEKSTRSSDHHPLGLTGTGEGSVVVQGSRYSTSTSSPLSVLGRDLQGQGQERGTGSSLDDNSFQQKSSPQVRTTRAGSSSIASSSSPSSSSVVGLPTSSQSSSPSSSATGTSAAARRELLVSNNNATPSSNSRLPTRPSASTLQSTPMGRQRSQDARASLLAPPTFTTSSTTTTMAAAANRQESQQQQQQQLQQLQQHQRSTSSSASTSAPRQGTGHVSELSSSSTHSNTAATGPNGLTLASSAVDLAGRRLREEQQQTRVKAAQDFIEKTLDQRLPSDNLHESLRDGVLLCKLANRLRPGTVEQISLKNLPFVKMENISNFLNAARQLGVQSSDLFQTVDLYEGKDMVQVVSTILTLARVVGATARLISSKPQLNLKGKHPEDSHQRNSPSPTKSSSPTSPPGTTTGLGSSNNADSGDSSAFNMRSRTTEAMPLARARSRTAASLSSPIPSAGSPSRFEPPKQQQHHISIEEQSQANHQAAATKAIQASFMAGHKDSSENLRQESFTQLRTRHLSAPPSARALSTPNVNPGLLNKDRNSRRPSLNDIVAGVELETALTESPDLSTSQGQSVSDSLHQYRFQTKKEQDRQEQRDLVFGRPASSAEKPILGFGSRSPDSSIKSLSLDMAGRKKKYVSLDPKVAYTPQQSKHLQPTSNDLAGLTVPKLTQSSSYNGLSNIHESSAQVGIPGQITSLKQHMRFASERAMDPSLPHSHVKSTTGSPSTSRSTTPVQGTRKNTGEPPKEKLELIEDGSTTAVFQLGNCIGKGQFGSVYKALNMGTGQMVAVKRIKTDGLGEAEMDMLMQEVDLLKSLEHPSIVKYEGFIKSSDHLNIILEFVENGSLLTTLRNFGGKFPEKLVVAYVVKILEGLVYLHYKEVVHCDLKAANILTTKNGNVKLSDFGVSLNLKVKESDFGAVAGTPNWMAPEVIELKGASPASDIWSLGCTIIELLTGHPPYADLLAMTTLFRIVEDERPPLPNNVSVDLLDFLCQCFQKDPESRPSAGALGHHVWIRRNMSSAKELKPMDSLPYIKRRSMEQKEKVYLANVLAPEPVLDTTTATFKQTRAVTPAGISSDSFPSNANKAVKALRRSSMDSASAFYSSSTLPNPSTGGAQASAVSGQPVRKFHQFVKSSFAKPVECRLCHEAVKKQAVICQDCNLVFHRRCQFNIGDTCFPNIHLSYFQSVPNIKLLAAQDAAKAAAASASNNGNASSNSRPSSRAGAPSPLPFVHESSSSVNDTRPLPTPPTSETGTKARSNSRSQQYSVISPPFSPNSNMGRTATPEADYYLSPPRPNSRQQTESPTSFLSGENSIRPLIRESRRSSKGTVLPTRSSRTSTPTHMMSATSAIMSSVTDADFGVPLDRLSMSSAASIMSTSGLISSLQIGGSGATTPQESPSFGGRDRRAGSGSQSTLSSVSNEGLYSTAQAQQQQLQLQQQQQQRRSRPLPITSKSSFNMSAIRPSRGRELLAELAAEESRNASSSNQYGRESLLLQQAQQHHHHQAPPSALDLFSKSAPAARPDFLEERFRPASSASSRSRGGNSDDSDRSTPTLNNRESEEEDGEGLGDVDLEIEPRGMPVLNTRGFQSAVAAALALDYNQPPPSTSTMTSTAKYTSHLGSTLTLPQPRRPSTGAGSAAAVGSAYAHQRGKSLGSLQSFGPSLSSLPSPSGYVHNSKSNNALPSSVPNPSAGFPPPPPVSINNMGRPSEMSVAQQQQQQQQRQSDGQNNSNGRSYLRSHLDRHQGLYSSSSGSSSAGAMGSSSFSSTLSTQSSPASSLGSIAALLEEEDRLAIAGGSSSGVLSKKDGGAKSGSPYSTLYQYHQQQHQLQQQQQQQQQSSRASAQYGLQNLQLKQQEISPAGYIPPPSMTTATNQSGIPARKSVNSLTSLFMDRNGSQQQQQQQQQLPDSSRRSIHPLENSPNSGIVTRSRTPTESYVVPSGRLSREGGGGLAQPRSRVRSVTASMVSPMIPPVVDYRQQPQQHHQQQQQQHQQQHKQGQMSSGGSSKPLMSFGAGYMSESLMDSTFLNEKEKQMQQQQHQQQQYFA